MCRHCTKWKQRGHLGEESPNPGRYFGHTPWDTLGDMSKNVKERATSLIDREGEGEKGVEDTAEVSVSGTCMVSYHLAPLVQIGAGFCWFLF